MSYHATLSNAKIRNRLDGYMSMPQTRKECARVAKLAGDPADVQELADAILAADMGALGHSSFGMAIALLAEAVVQGGSSAEPASRGLLAIAERLAGEDPGFDHRDPAGPVWQTLGFYPEAPDLVTARHPLSTMYAAVPLSPAGEWAREIGLDTHDQAWWLQLTVEDPALPVVVRAEVHWYPDSPFRPGHGTSPPPRPPVQPTTSR